MKKSDFYNYIRKRGLILIIILGLIIRLLFFWGEDNTTVDSDSIEYDQPARNLITDLSFQSFGTVRTPGYPVFLAVIYSITSYNTKAVFLVQIVLNIITLILIYKIADLFFSEKIALLSAFLFAIDVHQASYCVTLMTDTLFVTLFIASVYYLCKVIKEFSLWGICASSFFLGLATLVRPISFLFPSVAVFSLLVVCGFKLKVRLVYSLLFVLVFIAVLSPWLIRNYVMYDEAKLTSLSGVNLLFYNVAFTEVYKTGEKVEKIRDQFYDLSIAKGADLSDTLSFKNSIIYTNIAKQYIKDNFGLYCKKNLLGIINMFVNLDSRFLGSFFHAGTNSIDFFSSKNILSLIKVYFQTKSLVEIIIAFFLVPFLLINYLFSLYGSILLMRKYDKLVFLFLLIIIYFSFITGVVGVARYKLPIMPFINILCAIGLAEFYSRFSTSTLVRGLVNKSG
jgi:4-amino-4-deoxy-L-arabinose transferase-like glycosyltransferase